MGGAQLFTEANNAVAVFAGRFARRQPIAVFHGGRGAGVGRDRGVGVGRPPGVGDGVNVAFGVALGVGVVVGVAVGVAVAVGVGVGVGEPNCAQYLPPVFK